MTALFRSVLAVVAALAATGVVLAADTLKIRHLATAYTDSKSVPLGVPQGVACGAEVVAVADGDGRVVLFEPAEKGLLPRSEIAVPQAPSPLRVEFASGGDLLVLDGKTRRIARLSSTGEFKRYLDVATAPGRTLAAPRSLAVGGDGRIFVLDAASWTIAVFDKEGAPAGRITLPEGGGYSDLAVAGDGTLFVADAVNARVLTAPRGGKAAAAWSPDLRTVEIEFPASLAVSASGRVLVLDGHAGTVIPLHGDGSAGTPALGFGWDERKLRYPSDICLDGKGRLVVADRDNRRVQIFQLAD